MVDKVINLDREIVANCPNCKSQLFYILLDKPNFENIVGFQCVSCEKIIEIHLTTAELRPKINNQG